MNKLYANEPGAVAFLEELAGLTRKYGLKVWGCGCCGSPELVKLEPEEFGEEYEYNAGYQGELDWSKAK